MTEFADLMDLLRAKARAHRTHDDQTYVIGVTGSVAVGKSTLAEQIAEALSRDGEKPLVLNVDGFLYTNTVLQERNLSRRKGYPESYDLPAMRAALAAIKRGEQVSIPRYSHVTYDVDSSNPRIVERPAVVVLDGLHLGSINSSRETLVDTLLYLDAAEDVVEAWFSDRLRALMIEGREEPASFYYAFRAMDDSAREAFIKMVWRDINLPNLRDHIVLDRMRADIVAHKAADHMIDRIDLKSIS